MNIFGMNKNITLDKPEPGCKNEAYPGSRFVGCFAKKDE